MIPTSKVGLAVSIALHVIVIALLLALVAREAMLGKRFQKIAVTMVPKERPPENPIPAPKPKPVKKPTDSIPAREPVKIENPKLENAPPSVQSFQSVAARLR